MLTPRHGAAAGTINGVVYVAGGGSAAGSSFTKLNEAFSLTGSLPPQPQVVTGLALINADTDQPISGFNPLPNGATLNLAKLPTRNLNIRANTSPALVGSVRFRLDTNSNYRTENTVPYALAGDSSGNFHPWTPSVGSHTVSATPYSGSNATGTAGTALTISFTVTDSP